MPLPAHFDATHLHAAVVPVPEVDAPDAGHAAAVAALDVAATRIDVRRGLLNAWSGRFPLLPPPPRTRTLQEAVQAARARLRDERADADLTELVNRRFTVEHLRAGLR